MNTLFLNVDRRLKVAGFNWSLSKKNDHMKVEGLEASAERGTSIVLMEPKFNMNDSKSVKVKCSDVTEGV